MDALFDGHDLHRNDGDRDRVFDHRLHWDNMDLRDAGISGNHDYGRRGGFLQFWRHWVEKTLEWDVATHSSTLAWKIPWTEELGGLQSVGSQRIGHA